MILPALHPIENQVCLDSDETGGCRSPSPPCLSSTASLPSLPSSHPNNNNNLITYSRCPSLATVCFVKIIGIPNPVAPGQPHLCQLGKPTSKTWHQILSSKFARSLSRRSSRASQTSRWLLLSKVVIRAVSKKIATTNNDFQTIMSQVLFPKLATSNVFQKIA